MVELEAITVTGLRLDDNSPYNTYNRPNAEFSMTFGIEVLADGRLTAGKSSPGVTGRHSPEEALRQILAGTGLEARSTPSGTMTIEPAPEAGPEPEHLAQATPPPELELVILPEITVTASPLDDTSYNPPNATTATKTDTPIMETPVNIQVVPQQVLKDQQVIRLDDALRNVSGVIAHGTGFFDGAESFNIRGFQDFQVFRDGIQSGGRAHGAEETAHLERIEVLKGPAAILYGRIEPGGLINQVSKQPLAAPFYSLAQQFGSFDFYRTTVDAGGPLNDDHSLKYRFNLAYEDAGSFVDFIENDRIFVAPVVRWDVSPATQITLQLQYKEGSDPLNPGIPFIGDRPAPVSRDTFLGEPGFGTDHREVYAGFHWSHAFNDDWTLSHRFIANPGRTDARPIFFQAIDGSRVARFLQDQRSPDDSYDTTMDLTGHLDTWGIAHTLLMGGDYTRNDIQTNARVVSLPSIDLFRPRHDASRGPDFSDFDIASIVEEYGFYLQDQVNLPFNLHFLGGFRYDRTALVQKFALRSSDGTGFTQVFDLPDDALTPRYGLLWRPIPEVSLYGSYTENFGAGNGTDESGQPLPPETAQQWEVGIKTELLDGRLTGTLALFDLTKQNISRTDSANPLFSILTGEVRHRGLEFDLAGEIAPGCNLIGSYAYLDSEVTADSQQEVDADGNVIGVNEGITLINPLIISPLYDAEDFAVEGLCLQ